MAYKLSICIPTLNRGNYIGETLESIIQQLEHGVEIVIVDGGSTDNTEQIVTQYQASFPDIRYVRINESEKSPSNEGFDRDCNHAVELANGEYCWLMTDDDLLVPGAIRKIFNEIGKGYAIIVASVRVLNKDFSEVLIPRRPDVKQDIIFEPNELNKFAVIAGQALTFVGAVIVKKQFWLSRRREKYFGSGFVHVGVIFDERIRENVLVLADPLVSIRYGNAQWSNRAFMIWMFNWPELIWSFTTILDTSKQLIVSKEPWRKPKKLLMMRALGRYSIKEYQSFLNEKLSSKWERRVAKLIARIPRRLLLLPAYLCLLVIGSRGSLDITDLKNSFRSE